MVNNSFIEKIYVVGTHWNCLIEAISMCTYNIMLLKIRRKLFGNLHFPSIMSIVLTSFKHPNQYFNTCHYMANCLYLHGSYITKLDFINYAFAKLVLAWLYLASYFTIYSKCLLASEWSFVLNSNDIFISTYRRTDHGITITYRSALIHGS